MKSEGQILNKPEQEPERWKRPMADGGHCRILRSERNVTCLISRTARPRFAVSSRAVTSVSSLCALLKVTQPAPAYFLLLAIIRVGLRVARESFQSYCNVSSCDLTPPVQVLTPPSSHLLTFSSVACLYFGVIHNRHAQQLSHIAIGNMGMKNQSKASPAVA